MTSYCRRALSRKVSGWPWRAGIAPGSMKPPETWYWRRASRCATIGRRCTSRVRRTPRARKWEAASRYATTASSSKWRRRHGRFVQDASCRRTSGKVTCSAASLATGSSYMVSMTVQAAAKSGTVLTDTATVSSLVYDAAITNNSSGVRLSFCKSTWSHRSRCKIASRNSSSRSTCTPMRNQ